MRRLAVALAVATLMSGCSNNAQLTGSYIDTDYSDGALMVQIDSVDHRDVHGTITIASFDQNGAVHPRRVPISGTIEGKALNLTVENGTGMNMLNGTVVSDGLDLTMMGDGSSARFLFKRKDAADFNKVLANLRTQSAHTQQDTQEAAFKVQNAARGLKVQSQIDGYADELLRGAEAITAKSGQLNGAIAYYQRLSARNAQLRGMAARANSKSADGGDQLSDINNRLDGNRNLAASTHGNVQDFSHTVEGQSEGAQHRTDEFMTDCRTDSRLSCTRLASAAAEYANSVSVLRTAVAREEAAYNGSRF